MIRIFIHGDCALNVDNDRDAEKLKSEGARELSIDEIEAYGMKGYENYVSPKTTIVNGDGSIAFTPPSSTVLAKAAFDILRVKRDAKLAATDYYIMPDYPASEESKAAVMAYRQALRDLPSLEGAPWDGGESETPWPVLNI